MFSPKIRRWLVPALMALGLQSFGCVWEVGPPAVVEGYTPAYYDGHVVYYDDGRPYYYQDGVVVWVPRAYVHYNVLVRHYHGHARPYRHWYVTEVRHTVDRHGYSTDFSCKR